MAKDVQPPHVEEHPPAAEQPRDDVRTPPARPPGQRVDLLLNRIVHFLVALFLFVLAIQLMKKGAQAIAPRLQGTFPFDNGVSTLGLGWLGAYLVLSG
ncbi:MAG TPA: hypothetical protein VM638_08130, partial [Actinomycetota bacterium]|nr:hypothetical protein [Actinomycetota bacterium]